MSRKLVGREVTEIYRIPTEKRGNRETGNLGGFSIERGKLING